MAKAANQKAAAERARKVSRHRHGTRIVEVERRWADIHLDAGYHEQEWGEHSKRGHALVGDYRTDIGETLRVDHVDDHPEIGGPVFRILLPRGDYVDVLCADTVRAYLDLHGAAPVGT